MKTLRMWPPALALIACGVQAQTVGLHLASVHVPSETYLSGVNPGVYVRFGNGATFGAYRNSFGRTSAYAAWTWDYGPVSLTAGGISGYQVRHVPRACTAQEFTDNGWTHCWTDEGNTHDAIGLLLAPSVALPAVLGFVPRITALPRFTAKGHTVVHLSVERSFQ